jgi:hypothetical protein
MATAGRDNLEVWQVAARNTGKGRRKAGEPRVIGAKEAAEILGVKQTNIRTVRGLPEPYDQVAATTLWRESEIKAFARQRNRRLERERGDH